MQVKNRLLDIRLQMGYKFQKDFAKYIGLSQYQYNRYENQDRQPTLELALKISTKLNKSVNDIFYLVD